MKCILFRLGNTSKETKQMYSEFFERYISKNMFEIFNKVIWREGFYKVFRFHLSQCWTDFKV